MSTESNYPAGASCDPSAPFNAPWQTGDDDESDEAPYCPSCDFCHFGHCDESMGLAISRKRLRRTCNYAVTGIVGDDIRIQRINARGLLKSTVSLYRIELGAEIGA